MCSRRLLKRGELRFCCEIWIKPRNRRYGLFHTTLKFFTRVEGGGSEAPIRRLARWGLLLKLHRTSLAEKSNFNTRVCFLRLLLHDLYGPSHILTVFRNGAEKLNNSNKSKIRRFQPVGEAAETLNGLCEKLAELRGDDTPSKTCLRLPIGETFYVRRTALVAHFCRANRWFLITDF